MSHVFKIHPKNPQRQLLMKAAMVIRRGGVIVYPTDSSYALGCRMGDKAAMEKMRALRRLPLDHHFTLVCRDLSEMSTYATINNENYRLIKSYIPGPYTFLLKASKEVPRRLQHPDRKTIGLRVPDHSIAQGLLEALSEPLISTTLILPGGELPLLEPEAIKDVLGKRVDLIIDGGFCGSEPTTLIDLIEDGNPHIIRRGKGDITHIV